MFIFWVLEKFVREDAMQFENPSIGFAWHFLRCKKFLWHPRYIHVHLIATSFPVKKTAPRFFERLLQVVSKE